MILKIITPENIILDDNKIKSITLTTENGVITILDNHEPIVSILKTGEVIIKKICEKNKIEEIIMTINSGFVEVRPKEFSNNKEFEVIILTEESKFLDDLNINDIENAKNRAEIAMNEQINEIEFVRLEVVLERELNKIKILNKYRPKK